MQRYVAKKHDNCEDAVRLSLTVIGIDCYKKVAGWNDSNVRVVTLRDKNAALYSLLDKLETEKLERIQLANIIERNNRRLRYCIGTVVLSAVVIVAGFLVGTSSVVVLGAIAFAISVLVTVIYAKYSL